MNPRLALVVLTLTGCVVGLRPQPPSAELDARLPQNRDGIGVGDELVRATWVPSLGAAALEPDALATFDAILDSTPESFLVASRQREGRLVLTFAGAPARYRGGLLPSKQGSTPALARARARSAFHAPVKASLGGAGLWIVHDAVPFTGQDRGGEHLLTLEVYTFNPRERWARGEFVGPKAIWVFGRRPAAGKELLRDDARVFVRWDAGFFRIARLERAPDGRLTAIEFEPWKPQVNQILAGKTASDFLAVSARDAGLQMERFLNDALLEWKTRRLQGWAAAATPVQLEDAILGAEKGMLELDRASRLMKDRIDAAARDGASTQPGMTEAAQLLDQRKIIVAAVLGTLKQARAAAR